MLEYCANWELHPSSAGLGVLSGQSWGVVTPRAKAFFNSLAKSISDWHYQCCQRARLEQIDLTWNHESHGSFIRGECADVSLLFDSSSRCWTLRIYKRQTSFGHPVTYEISFKERYGPTVEQAIALANDILVVELENSPVTSHPPHL